MIFLSANLITLCHVGFAVYSPTAHTYILVCQTCYLTILQGPTPPSSLPCHLPRVWSSHRPSPPLIIGTPHLGLNSHEHLLATHIICPHHITRPHSSHQCLACTTHLPPSYVLRPLALTILHHPHSLSPPACHIRHMLGHMEHLVFRFLLTLQVIRHRCICLGAHLNRFHLRTRCPHPCGLPNPCQLGIALSLSLFQVLCGLRWVRRWVLTHLQRQHGPCLQECRHIQRWLERTRRGSTRPNSRRPSKFLDTKETPLKLHSDGRTMPIAWIPLPKDRTVRYTHLRIESSIVANAPCYCTDGPVLEPFLVKVVGAAIKLNPLLAPPSDTQDDYLRWNMLFHTSNCYRTTESQRSWVKGRNAPATHPRLTHIRVICRTFPWMIHARAQNPKLGVTCGEVLDAISTYLYGDVAKKEYENLPTARKRQIWDGYKFNRSTDSNAPGGRLGEGLKRLDWLGSSSRYGGLVQSDVFVKEHCGDVLPCTFELKCLPSYPLTAEELREQQRRLENPQRHRSRSRHTSNTNSRQPSPRSTTVRTASEEEEEEED